MQNACYCSQILTKIEFARQIFEKYASIKRRENPSSWSRVGPCGQKDGRTDRHGDAKSRFSQFRPNTPTKCTAATTHDNALWSKNTTKSLCGEVGGLKASDFGTQIPLCGDQTK
jgi:hypothetical protein